MTQVRVGLALPRRVGDAPFSSSPPSHRDMLRYGQRAEELGFDSVWVPDHFYFEWPAGSFEPYPEAWTLLTAIGVTTRRVQIGTLVLGAAFRHPALLAKMAGALQELSGGRLLLGLGAGNQPAEHSAFGLKFDGRVARFAEYLEVLHGLLSGQPITFQGRYYSLTEASLRMPSPAVPIWVAATGPRMLKLAARFADGWNGGGNLTGDGAGFRASLAELRSACQQQGRDPNAIEVSCSSQVLVLPDAAATRATIQHVASVQGWPEARVRDRYVVGTPGEVAARLAEAHDWGVAHHICHLGGRAFTLWSDGMLDLFASQVLPLLRAER